jgi:hypothetical protein
MEELLQETRSFYFIYHRRQISKDYMLMQETLQSQKQDTIISTGSIAGDRNMKMRIQQFGLRMKP